MMNYEDLIEAIRLCGSTPSVDQCLQCVYWGGGDMQECIPRMTGDAAAAIETLQAKLAARDALVDRLETENYRLRRMARRCIDCAYWRRDTNPETGAEVHICGNNASPRLDDLTKGSDHCGYWQADA